MRKSRRRKPLINKGNSGWKWGIIKRRYWDLIAECKEKGWTNKKVAELVNWELSDTVEDKRTLEMLKINASYIGKITRRGEYSIFLRERKEND